jgi:hypothetical protein
MLRKSRIFISWVLAGSAVFCYSQQGKWPEQNFFENSLHHTARGLAFWYSKEQGGMEGLTGVPISRLNCLNCHVESCDACHVANADGVPAYSVATARAQTACIECHGFGDVESARKSGSFVDVHFEKGMKCMDCHTSREIHGDGKIYDSTFQKGATDARCENCHKKVSSIPSHTVHKGKLDCTVCHLRELPSCHNCHMETRIREGKSVSLPLQNIFFLVNSRGKVALATCQTYVFRNRTMIDFAPSSPHTVSRQGRGCPECHASGNVRDIKAGTFRPATWSGGRLRNVNGIVPVLAGISWDFPFLNYSDGKWSPIQGAAAPQVRYVGYCTPITAQQFQKMQETQPRKK